jgi:hypothetical protein
MQPHCRTPGPKQQLGQGSVVDGGPVKNELIAVRRKGFPVYSGPTDVRYKAAN